MILASIDRLRCEHPSVLDPRRSRVTCVGNLKLRLKYHKENLENTKMTQTPSKCQSPSSTPKREQLETWLWLDLWRHLSERGRIGDAIGSADTTRVTAETSWSFGRATTYTSSPVLYVVPDTSCIRPHTQVNVLSASSQIFFSESRTTKLIEFKRRRSHISHTHTQTHPLYSMRGLHSVTCQKWLQYCSYIPSLFVWQGWLKRNSWRR